MKGENSKAAGQRSSSGAGFRISGGPVISNRTPAAGADHVPLPKTYGAPILFAIPRDPRTIFTYWNIDWSDAFARNAPADRRVYLRVKRQDGSAEIEEAIEPMLGSHFILVTQPNDAYQVELGFYDPANVWNVIATSDEVTMPADASSDNAEVDIATVPFHLSFQRMIDLFRATNGDAVASLVSSLQHRAGETSEAGQLLSNEEREILHAMDLSMADLEDARRSFGGRSVEELLRKKAEALLGFGGTSPSGGLGGSSWSSGLL